MKLGAASQNRRIDSLYDVALQKKRGTIADDPLGAILTPLLTTHRRCTLPGLKAIAAAILLGLAGILSGCDQLNSYAAPLPTGSPQLTGISVGPPDTSVAIGLTQQFTATGLYSDGSKGDVSSAVTWNSSSAVASISNAVNTKGLATATNVGPTTITATLGNVSGSTTLTATAATLVSIGLTPATASIARGLTEPFKATGVYTDNSTHDLTTSVTWSSSATTVASVSNSSGSNGLATAAAPGSTTVTATLGSVSGSTTLTVTPATLVSIGVTPANVSIAKGTTKQFAATGVYTDGSMHDLTGSVIWTSAMPNVGSITNTVGGSGLTTAANPGSTTITATLGSVSSSTTLTVTAATLVSIDVTPANPSVALGLKPQFTATGTYTDNSRQNLTTQVTWSSSNTAIATVSSAAGFEGLGAGLSPGSVTMTATLAGVSGSTTLTVTPATLVSIAVTPANRNLPAGLTNQFTATGTYTDNSTQNITTAVAWNSADTTIAAISNASGSIGLATAAGQGTVTITAALGSVSGSTTLTVTAATLVSIAVTPATPSILNGATQRFTATGTYTDNSTQNLTTVVTWISSDTTIATVSNVVGSNGLATSVANGATTISATSGTASGSTLLTVTQPHLYVADGGNVYFCSISATDGSISNCATTGSGFNQPLGIVFNGSHAYIANYNFPGGQSVSVCNVAADASLENCAIAASSVPSPASLAINSSTLYAVNGGGPGITYCTIAVDGGLSNCGTTASSFNSVGIAVASENVYLSNNGDVDLCAINGDGSLGSCTATGSGFSQPSGLTLAGTLAYVADPGTGFVNVCVVDANGGFGACAASRLTVGGYDQPTDVLISGSYAYVSDSSVSAIYVCSVSPANGSLSGCAVSPGEPFYIRPGVTIQMALH